MNLIVAQGCNLNLKAAMRFFHFPCLPFLSSDIIECKSKPNNIMRQFFLAAVGLSVLHMVSVSCNMTPNNQQTTPFKASSTSVSYEMPPADVTDPYDPEKFALDAGRGELRKEYFGIKLNDLDKDSDGKYVMTDEQRETFIKNIEGTHMCSLQWISWKKFGSVTFKRNPDGTLNCTGGQKSTTTDDYLKLDGNITVVNPLHLKFTGKIITCVSHINNGKPVVREGEFNFTVAGQRRYWRMREMNNPKDGCCDYVDIYFD